MYISLKSITSYEDGTPQTSTETEFLGLIGNNYKLQIINVDSQLSEVVNINVIEDYGIPEPVPLNTENAEIFGIDNV